MPKNTGRKEFQVPSDLSEVQGASAKVLEFLRPLRLADACVFDIRLCLEEALINAMKYGNRLQKEVPVRLAVEYDGGKVQITIEDRGPGFDVKALRDCTRGENRLKNCGRGVYLIHQLMDQVRYNAKGNQLVMVKQIGRRNGDGC